MIWGGGEPPEHKKFIEQPQEVHERRIRLGLGDRWAIMAVDALAAGIKKAGSTDSDEVSKALLGLTFDTPVGKRTFSAKTHETVGPANTGARWSRIRPIPFAVIKDPSLRCRRRSATN